MNWVTIYIFLILLVSITNTSALASQSHLADAAEKQDTVTVRSLLEDGVDINSTQIDGTTALHWATYYDDVSMAKLLVQSGSEVDAVNIYGVRPLSLACLHHNTPLVNLLLDAGANANTSRPGGETVLMTAARTGSLESVKVLLAHGADPNALERNGQSAIMWASAEGHTSVVEALIGAGANFRLRLNSGFNSMFFAVREGRLDVVRKLLEVGIDVNEAHIKISPTYRVRNSILPKSNTQINRVLPPLLMAIENGHFELAVELLKAGADPNDERTGFTPLHTITWVRKPEVSDGGSDPAPESLGNLSSLQFVQVLVTFGANINARLKKGESDAPKINIEGATPFLFAADKADVPLMKLLLELGADPLLANVEGTTPLMAAAGLGTIAPLEEAGTEDEALVATELLLQLGANIDAVDKNGETAMHGAAYGSFPTIVQLLAKKEANSEIWRQKNTHGWTPLFIAEGYRPGNFKPGPATIKALQSVMTAEGISTEGARPRHVGLYEKARQVKKRVRRNSESRQILRK